MKEKIKGLLMVLFSLSVMCGWMLWMDGIEGLLFVLKLTGVVIGMFTIGIIAGKGVAKLLD